MPSQTRAKNIPQKLLKKAHNNEVADALLTRDRDPNKVLKSGAPEIRIDELKFPLKTRQTIAQVRSSHSLFLKSYQHRINATDGPDDLCPD